MFLESREEEVKRVERESLAKGEAMAKEKDALGLLKEGLSAEIIARALDLRISEVRSIADCNGITLT